MITVVGVAHISEESIRKVEDKIKALNPDLIAVELCDARYKGLTHGKKVPILELIRNKNSSMLLVNILLPLLQMRLGKEVGAKPGREMLRAIELAKERKAKFALIDRDVSVTMKRAMAKMGFLEKIRVLKELITSLGASKKEIEKEISKAKDAKGLEEILKGFKKLSPGIYQVLVEERDAYMASNLLTLEKKFGNVIAVVGAGHKKGIEEYLSKPGSLPDIRELLLVPKKKITLGGIIKFGLPIFIIGMFVLALYKGVSIKGPVYLWVLNHAVPTFLAILLVRGSLSAMAAGTIASPLTSLNPFLAAGWFAGLAEMKARRVTVEDVSEMFKIGSHKELLGNNAFRVILVTALANIGSMLGTFISLPTIIYPLIKSVAG
ncbi:MAG: TraB/GumN family protein [Candidatus Hydrothermarchaeota archaeon]|nr:TraB/GumN family protein [Candidatus Hydrothermarchaeota archaeon]